VFPCVMSLFELTGYRRRDEDFHRASSP
jgi:hypothetical protein